jgi:hypothetical protein
MNLFQLANQAKNSFEPTRTLFSFSTAQTEQNS